LSYYDKSISYYSHVALTYTFTGTDECLQTANIYMLDVQGTIKLKKFFRNICFAAEYMFCYGRYVMLCYVMEYM